MQTLTEPGAVTTRRSSRLMWATLGLVLLADALDVIDATVTNIAAPTIASELNGGESLIKWLGPAYMLAMGVLLVAGGRLGDKFGQRRLFLIGISGFTLASAVAGLSPNPPLLIVARVAQGAFGALLIPQGMAIMTKAFSRDMLTKAFGLFGSVLAISSVGGPVLAGFVISADVFGLSWRPIFLINIILGVIGLIMAAKILPRDDDGDRSTVVDGWGSGLLAVTMIGLLYGLIEGSTNGWSAVPVASVTAGVLLFAAFAYRQRTATHPLIKPSLLKNRGFTSGLLVCLAGTGLLFVLSLFLQEGLHVSPRGTSLALVPLTLGLVAAGFAAMGGLAAKLGRRLVFIGLTVDLAGCGWVLVLVAYSETNVSLWALAPAFFVIGVGMGLSFATILVVALDDAKPEEAGSASGYLLAERPETGSGRLFIVAKGPHRGQPLTPEGLRHTFGTALAEAGVDAGAQPLSHRAVINHPEGHPLRAASGWQTMGGSPVASGSCAGWAARRERLAAHPVSLRSGRQLPLLVGAAVGGPLHDLGSVAG